MDFDTQQAFALIMAELKEINHKVDRLEHDVSEFRQEIGQNMATLISAQTKMQSELSAKDKELETVASRNSYNIALLQGKAQ